MPGTVASPVGTVQVSRFGLWLAIGDAEHFLNFTHFPWFRTATIGEICEATEVSQDHFHWSRLDVDLDLDTIRDPGKYPLVYRA